MPTEAHTPECMADWLAASDAPCICGVLTYPQRTLGESPAAENVEKSRAHPHGAESPATPTDTHGIRALDSLGHDGPSAPDGPQQHGPARRLTRAIEPGNAPVIHRTSRCRWCKGKGLVLHPCPLCGALRMADGTLVYETGSVWGDNPPPVRPAKRGRADR